jgi:hypothetical protein
MTEPRSGVGSPGTAAQSLLHATATAPGTPDSHVPSSVPYDADRFNMLVTRWPHLAASPVSIGGITVTCAQAVFAAGVLAGSRTSAIAPVLKGAASPLAACDYFAAAAPYLAAARSAPRTGRSGAAGRHVTKNAFTAAIADALESVIRAELLGGVRALGTDERYAVAIATEAVAVRERAHAAGVRAAVRTAALNAVAQCQAACGTFSCASASACGTGSCRFAPAVFAAISVPAREGRIARPANHVGRGTGFSEATAAAAAAAALLYRVGVPVSDSEVGHGEDLVA